MKLRVQHSTSYSYAEKVRFTPHKVLLRPREDHETRVNRFSLTALPRCEIKWFRDTQENSIAQCFIEGESKQLVLHAEMEVELLQDNPFDFIIDASATRFPFSYSPADQSVLKASLDPLADSGSVADWTRQVFSGGNTDTLELLTRLNSAVFRGLSYNRREEMGIQNPDETLKLGSGSCRDFALLFMAVCRNLGLATRFVSGYLYTPPPDESQGATENRADNAMHAWCEVYLPGAGWRGFDPTHGILSSDYYIPVAVSAFPEEINPIQGSYLSPHPVENSMTAEVRLDKLD